MALNVGAIAFGLPPPVKGIHSSSESSQVAFVDASLLQVSPWVSILPPARIAFGFAVRHLEDRLG